MSTADPLVPCIHCNDTHKGASLHHAHEGVEGVGYIRLLVIGNGKAEFCWRCSCRKSGWVNRPNDVTLHCADPACLCHTAERAR